MIDERLTRCLNIRMLAPPYGLTYMMGTTETAFESCSKALLTGYKYPHLLSLPGHFWCMLGYIVSFIHHFSLYICMCEKPAKPPKSAGYLPCTPHASPVYVPTAPVQTPPTIRS